MNKGYLLLWILALIGLIGCRACTEAPPVQEISALAEVPLPDFEPMEPRVREQLQAMQDSVDTALARPDPDPATLSRLFGALGQHYQAYQDYHEAARVSFMNARALDAEAFEWAYYLGHLLKGIRPEESVQQFEDALALNPDYLPTYIALAERYTEANRLDEAERLLNAARERDESSPRIYVGLGQIASIRNAHDEAVAHLETAKRLAPEATQINYLLGMAYRAQGNREKAVQLLAQQGRTQAPLADPLMDRLNDLATGAHALKMEANRAYLEQRYTDALAAYRQAMAVDSNNAEIHTNLAVTLVALNQGDEAMGHLEEALRLNPEREVALFSMGTLLAQQGRDADAIPYYQRALQQNPDYRDALFNMANAHFRLGQYNEAILHYARVVDLDPQNRTARYRQAWALVRSQQWEAVSTALEAGYAAHPGDPEIGNLLARMLAACPVDALRDGTRAHDIAQALLASNQSFQNAEVLALALAELGRFEEAVSIQERLLATAQQAARPDLESRLAANLTHYRNGRPVRSLDGI